MKLGVVIPCYNEQEVLELTITQITQLLDHLVRNGAIDDTSKVWAVDDDSNDSTWKLIEGFAKNNNCVSGIKLSRNRGHQNALLAGLLTADDDVLISIDADLQDDIHIINNMLEDYQNGADIVYGVRKTRNSDSFFKRNTAELFYRLIENIGAKTIYNHSDYRLMSRRAIEALREFREVNLFLRGIVPLIGFKSSIVYFDRNERYAGTSKYPLGKMIALAIDAVTSFSIIPLRFITFAGFLIFILSMMVTLWILWVKIFTDNAVPGWASTVLPMYFLGGIQIFCIGVIGEYLGKTYAEVKSRPRFIIEKII
jgi:polyisoprenyl-phosphate glycosyltransferase